MACTIKISRPEYVWMCLGTSSWRYTKPTQYLADSEIPPKKISTKLSCNDFEKGYVIAVQAYRHKPNKYMGLLPYISAKRGRNNDPRNAPAKNIDPNRPNQ